jgi:hypothetical protein
MNDAKRYHAAAKIYEAYFACCDRFGPDIAGMVLVMWMRCHHPNAE